MGKLIDWFVAKTKTLVWRIATAYDIQINRFYYIPDYPDSPVIFEDDRETLRHHVPKTVWFCTGSGTIRVGKGTIFGEHVMLLAGKHYNVAECEQRGLRLHSVPRSGYDITIGRGCWIASGAIILGRNITIGDYAVVGAGSVVTHDVPPRTLVAGNPAKVVKRLQ